MFSFYVIGDRNDGVCLQLHGQVSRLPKRCRFAMFDTKGRAFCCVSNSLFDAYLEDVKSMKIRNRSVLGVKVKSFHSKCAFQNGPRS